MPAIIQGADAIAAHLGAKTKSPLYWLRSRGVPTFRKGRIHCAATDVLDAWKAKAPVERPRVALPRRRRQRRAWSASELMLAAFLAGQGRTGGEVAGRLGGTTGPRVRSRLRAAGVHMTDQAVLAVALPGPMMAGLEELASGLGLEPARLLSDVVAVLAAEPSLLAAVLPLPRPRSP
jgi:hypothetical protein